MEPVEYGPSYGEILTIHTVVQDEDLGVGLHFVEYPVDPNGFPPLFRLTDFRPLIDQSADVALFAHHLDRAGEPA